jgi:hypothetical protein
MPLMVASNLHRHRQGKELRRRRELGYGLGTLADSVFGKFTGKHESDGRLDFARAERRLLVVRGQFTGFSSDAFKDIVDERVHDGHTLLRDTCVGMNLFEHLVDVRRIRLHALLRFGALATGGGLFGGCGFRRLLGRSLGHGAVWSVDQGELVSIEVEIVVIRRGA